MEIFVGIALGSAAVACWPQAKKRFSPYLKGAEEKCGDLYVGVAQKIMARVEAIEDAAAERRYRKNAINTDGSEPGG